MTMQLIASYTLPADTTTYTFSALQSYDDLFIVASARGYGLSGTDRDALALRFNADNTSVYTYFRGYAIGSARGSDFDTADRLLLGYIPGRNAAPSNVYSATTIYIPQYRSTSSVKTLICDSNAENTTNGSNGISFTTGVWNNSGSAISSITFGIWDGFGSYSLLAGSTLSIYGIST